MASIFLKSLTTLLLFFSTLSIAITLVLDLENKPLLIGKPYYYTMPNLTNHGGGPTRTRKNEFLECPYYIKQAKDEFSDGEPLIINSPLGKLFTPLSSNLTNIGFKDLRSSCYPMGWQVVPNNSTGRLYVVTGGNLFDPAPRFIFEEDMNFGGPAYNIKYLDNSSKASNVGFFKDGFLGITNEIPVTIVFKKAFIETNSSS